MHQIDHTAGMSMSATRDGAGSFSKTVLRNPVQQQRLQQASADLIKLQIREFYFNVNFGNLSF